MWIWVFGSNSSKLKSMMTSLCVTQGYKTLSCYVLISFQLQKRRKLCLCVQCSLVYRNDVSRGGKVRWNDCQSAVTFKKKKKNLAQILRGNSSSEIFTDRRLFTVRNDHGLTIYSRWTYHEERSRGSEGDHAFAGTSVVIYRRTRRWPTLATTFSPPPSFLFRFEFSSSVLVRCRFPAGWIRELFVIFRSVCPGNSDVLRLAFPAAVDVENVDAFKINRGTFPREKETSAPFSLLRVPFAPSSESAASRELVARR